MTEGRAETQAPLNRLPKLYATERQRNPMVHVRYHHRCTGWQWFATEYNGERIFFGLVAGFEVELGYFDRVELEQCGCILDPDWQPIRLSQVRLMLHK